MNLSRRMLLTDSVAAGTLALAGLAGTDAVQAATAASNGKVEIGRLSFKDLRSELEALIRVECNLAPVDSPVWFYWVAFAICPDIPPTPVVDFEGLEMSRVVRRGDGSYFVKGIDLSFPRDHLTGEFTQTARHPVTGESIEVPVSVLDGNFDPGYVVSPEVGWWPLKAPKPATVNLHCRWWREGNTGRLRRERTAPPGFPRTFIESSYYEFSMADFNNEHITSVRYRTGGVYVFPFPKWMKMGDRPGHMLGMITGRKLASVTQLPREFLERAEKEQPQLLNLDRLFQSIPPPA